jgi:hypothetical protein
LEYQYFYVCQAKFNFSEYEFRRLPTSRRLVYLNIAKNYAEKMENI